MTRLLCFLFVSALLMGCSAKPKPSLVGVWQEENAPGSPLMQLRADGKFDIVSADGLFIGVVEGTYTSDGSRVSLRTLDGHGLGNATWSYRWVGKDDIILSSDIDRGKQTRLRRLTATTTPPKHTITGAQAAAYQNDPKVLQSTCLSNMKQLGLAAQMMEP